MKFFAFLAKKIGKFKDWLGIGSAADTKTSTAVVEILSYLAYETVNEVILKCKTVASHMILLQIMFYT